MTTREYLLDVAASKLGNYAKGSPEVFTIWRDVLPPGMSDDAVRLYAKTADWCGGFVLHCLREAKLLDAHWQIGSGFVLRIIGAKAATKNPQPGDIGILQRRPGATKDTWHHFLFEGGDISGEWTSIDGNSPTCARKSHASVILVIFRIYLFPFFLESFAPPVCFWEISMTN